MSDHLARQTTSAMVPTAKADTLNRIPAIKSRCLPMNVAVFVDQIPDDSLFYTKAFARCRDPYTCVIVDETITADALKQARPLLAFQRFGGVA